MAILTIKHSTKEALDDCMPGFQQLGVQLPDGSWSIPLKEGNFAWLDQIKIPGEPIDATLLRMIRMYNCKQRKAND